MNEAAYKAILKRMGVDTETHEVIAHLVKMPLNQFEREGRPMEVRVPWLGTTLWWVPTEAETEALMREGISRGRIWTARELMDLASISALTPEQARTVAATKAEFGGEIAEVRKRTTPLGAAV